VLCRRLTIRRAGGRAGHAMPSVEPQAEGRAAPPRLRPYLRSLYARRETIRFLTISGLQAGHRDKILGNLWNILDPLLYMLVYYVVFGILFALAGAGKTIQFMLYIFVGVLTYRFIESTISQAANCVRGNRGLIHEINFPKAVFPISVVLARLYDFVLGLAILIVFLLVARVWPTAQYLWLPLLVASAVLFTLGASFIVAYLGAFYADTSNVVTVVMRLLFYCSPIFYFVRTVGGFEAMRAFRRESIRAIYMLNPIAGYLESFRDALLWGSAPDYGTMLYIVLISVLVALAGLALFARGEGKFAKYV